MALEIYSPLDPQSSCIRVVHLLPGEFSDPILCNLETIQFSDNSGYKALSYVWGDAKIKIPITLCGQTAWVTTNLESALRHLRLPNTARALWIDALCINQLDTAERTHQVRLMRHIYQNAAEVLIWLGPKSIGFHAETFIDNITRISEDTSMHWFSSDFSKFGSFVHFFNDHMSGFFRMPWWTRIWTVQECILAKQATFFLGSDSFSGSLLRGLNVSFVEHHGCCFNGDGRMSLLVPDQLKADMDQLRSLLILQETKNSPGLLQVLTKFRNRHATEPVDKIFGLLGLVDMHSEELVDYRLTPENVFEETTIRVIESTENLDVFSQCSSVWKRSSFEALPTWAPSWSHDDQEHFFNNRNMRFHCLPLFQASKDVKIQMSRPEAKMLTVKGLAVDLVDEVCDASYYFDRWWPMVQKRAKTLEMYRSGSSWLEAFWRTVWMDIDFDAKRKAGECDPLLLSQQGLDTETPYSRLPVPFDWGTDIAGNEDQRQSQAPSNLLDQTLSQQMNKYWFECWFGREFFFTRKGYMGVGPQHMAVGDTVCILYGGRVPYVLRKVASGTPSALQNDRASDCWNFIGDAYVHGLMDGEALDLAENNEAEPRDFTLI